jgi:GTPase SAR1 family protein
MLLGNKCDLPNRQVTSEEGQKFARSKGFGFMEVSAKNNIGVTAAFTGLASNIYSQIDPQFGSDMQNPRGVSLMKTSRDDASTPKKKKDCKC